MVIRTREKIGTSGPIYIKLMKPLKYIAIPEYGATILLFLSLFLPLLLSVIFLKHKTTTKLPLNLPPGPRPLPFLRNLHHLVRYSLPHHAMQDLSRQYGPLMLLQLGEIPTVIASSPEAASEILKTHDITFAARCVSTTTRILANGGKSLTFGPYGECWQQLRKICNMELLSMKQIQSFRSIQEEEVCKLMQYISSCSSRGQAVDLSTQLEVMVNDTASRVIIGSRCKDQAMLLREIDIALRLWSGFNLCNLFPSSSLVSFVSGAAREAERSRQAIDRFLDDIIEQNREKNTTDGEREGGDLVQVLLRIYEEDELHNSLDMKTEVITGDSETSSTIVGWAMSELIRNPKVMKKVQSEIRQLLSGRIKVSESDLVKLNYLHLVIKETLRLHLVAFLAMIYPKEQLLSIFFQLIAIKCYDKVNYKIK